MSNVNPMAATRKFSAKVCGVGVWIKMELGFQKSSLMFLARNSSVLTVK